MNLQIPDSDVPIVKETLDETMKHLLEEIVHADQRHFREQLKERYDRLDRLRREVDFAATGKDVSA